MKEWMMFLIILIPVLGGISIPLVPIKSRKIKNIYIETIVIINSLLVACLIFNPPEGRFEIVNFIQKLSLSLRMDGMSAVFGGLIAALWPLATLYAFSYMEHDKRQDNFFLFYTITYGITLGVAFSEDLLTMYFFYELLTLSTMPLVLHTMTREAVLAARKYLYYSLGGAAFAFIGLIFIISYGTTANFHLGGVLDLAKVGDKADVLLLIYVIAFFGFGVKAAICPFNSWLPQAGVAPTPVTALLHAVAIVKAGAFAIIRITHYSFGTDFLKGSWAQTVVMTVAIITIFYGSSRAIKETHIKRRLAYSTVSNLSYILFGAVIMTPMGLAAALTHMIFHGVMKITAFFCAGSIMHQSGKNYVYELNGLGRKMPFVFGVLTISSLGLMGVPGMAGFISKWRLAYAAVESENLLALAGVAVLLISALLTAIYMLTMVMRGFFPVKGDEENMSEKIQDPGWQMKLPLFILALAIVGFGLCSEPVTDFIQTVVEGRI
ncbi:MAG: proton-conducting transporter membrane subunit [Lachnospiraceae bacterium]|nr:proton-conducting transporter membrane subunit [Lachnospiraceae bacterium]MDY5699907.1 proton-conducting transporter membrane subunit [Lachnospiraceae bacterium]